MTPKQRRILVALISKQRGGELPYTILPQGIKCSTGEEFISTGAAWQESCVWEVGAYSVGGAINVFTYGYVRGGNAVVASNWNMYQLGSNYDPLGGTSIITPTVSEFHHTVNTVSPIDITSKIIVQNISQEKTGNAFVDLSSFIIGYRLYGVKATGMVIQSAKRTVNGVVTHDYVACDYNGQLGMWDRITDTFIGNSGTGEFVLP